MDSSNSAGNSGSCQCEIGNGGSSNNVNFSRNLVPIPTTSASTSQSPLIGIGIYPTTGGHFDLQVHTMDTIEHLKKMISKKLKVAKERICLLYKERDLREGSLRENNVQEGSRITLLPMVETGLLTQRPEQSVLQALESLSDAQVNDFLSGKAPLNLTMRLGDHMMFIQLQLSTVGTTVSRTKGLHSATSRATTSKGTTTDVHSIQSTSTALCPTPCGTPSTTTRVPEKVAPSSCGQRPLAPMSALRPCSSTPRAHRQRCLTDVTHLLDTRTLAEASRNLSQTLRHLSSQALNSRTDHEECPQHGSSRRQGAIIESMHHHGRGVYSGTFSGTLNPALQDRHGHPKRDISTIVHILNDLLGATPQYRRQNGRSIEPPSSVLQLHNHSINTVNSNNDHIFDATTKEYSRLNQENKATRGKMEQLQMMLEERRARRRARREAHAPYPVSWSTGSNHLTAQFADSSDGVNASTSQSMVVTDSDSATSVDDNEQDVKSPVGRESLIKNGSESPATSTVSTDGSPNPATPMECDASEEGLENSDNGSSGATEYLKLNPETVVA